MTPPTMSGPTHNPNRNRPAKWGVFWRDANGKKKGSWFVTEDEAARFIASATVLASIPEPTPIAAAARGTIGAYLDTWLATTIKPKREAATYRSYEQLVRVHIRPAIGSWKLADVGPVKVRQFYTDLYNNGIKLATRKHIHSCLSSAFTQATFDELIKGNPCLKLGRDLRHKDEQDLDPEPNPFTVDQAALFLDQVEAVEREWLEYFQFLHDTGCRVGEVAALKWANVDLDTARAKIDASYSPSDGKDKAPKTHQRRFVDLSDVVVSQLKDLRRRQRTDYMKRGRGAPTYVFTNKNGSPRRQDGNMRRVFDRVCADCKFTGHSPHDLRDTFATTHLMADYARLPWVSRQLGHETERTTIEHYCGYLPSTLTKGLANQIRAAAPTTTTGKAGRK